jgi:hypothetical protein
MPNYLPAVPAINCDYSRHVSIFYPFTIPFAILPLVIRVFPFFNNNKYVVAFFSVSWLSVLASGIAVPIGSIGIPVEIGTTKHCSHSLTELTYVLSSFCPAIHETLVFIATSWGLMRISYSDISMKNSIQVMVFGRHLFPFSRSILRDGQAYYL